MSGQLLDAFPSLKLESCTDSDELTSPVLIQAAGTLGSTASVPILAAPHIVAASPVVAASPAAAPRPTGWVMPHMRKQQPSEEAAPSAVAHTEVSLQASTTPQVASRNRSQVALYLNAGRRAPPSIPTPIAESTDAVDIYCPMTLLARGCYECDKPAACTKTSIYDVMWMSI